MKNDHAGLIDALGGGTKIAQQLDGLGGEKLDRDQVYKWKRNGVTWKWRPAVAQLAAQQGVTIPDGFMGIAA